ncbi:recombination protein NinG [Providencia rettgeri]|uniref:recombination protein NinG n=1 Tax=Providencia rettgeri TaxID=587 RepID=UPI00141953CB|nr:recombination protein NinG [Providencia rettgeri]NIA76325.1 recombination protein NinG [Providencia rettgeri]NIA80538.1 recombination protein NinG [Providencia rettgeri]NIB03758.1 recombination protein NinG [Providencia rettgeri]NIB07919.1 recombination protein NinG [Providencia rettgeri]NIB21556.1 recombination protein NinG [Providencia rettgeri]
MAKFRRRKCKICNEWFLPEKDFEKWCSQEHKEELAIRIYRTDREKKQKAFEKQQREKEVKARDKLKIRRLAVKSLKYFTQQAQNAFNAYIRYRDRNEPCISCERFHEGQYHAGHYRTTGANPELRFNEDNCHKQCAPCNNHLSGNIEKYTPNLIAKIGQERFDILMGFHELPKWKREDYERIRDYYRKKLKELKDG